MDDINDKKLNIETESFIEWPLFSNLNYNRTESTDYEVLKILTEDYLIDNIKKGQLVDFGSGTGRVLFYLYQELDKVKLTGIEYNSKTYTKLQENLDNFSEIYPDANNDIQLKKIKAENYVIQPTDSTFYFFNPFTVRIFKKIMTNIIDSVQAFPREVDIILYYPEKTYRHFLDKKTFFKAQKTIEMPAYKSDNNEYVVIYQN